MSEEHHPECYSVSIEAFAKTIGEKPPPNTEGISFMHCHEDCPRRERQFKYIQKIAEENDWV